MMLKGVKLALGIVALTVCASALARDRRGAGKTGDAGEDKAAADAFEQAVENFYRQPDAAKAIAQIDYALETAQDASGSIMPLAGFFHGAVLKTPQQKDAWAEARKKLDDGWLATAIDNGLAGKALEDIVPNKPESWGPSQLDFMWGCFFATGDAGMPRRIIHRGAFAFPEDAVIDLTQRAAQWSAMAIARKHEIVRAELLAFVNEADDKKLTAFFDGKVPEYAKEYLGAEAVKKIEAAAPPKKPEKPEPPLYGFTDDYDAALARAGKEGRSLFVFFTGSDWCVWCKKLVKEVFSHAAFLDYATNEFVCVVVDSPADEGRIAPERLRRNNELKTQFAVNGFPTVLVVDATQNVLHQAGYARGGATNWVARFKTDLRLAPQRKKTFGPLEKEEEELYAARNGQLREIGRPSDTNKAERARAVFAAWAEDIRRLREKLEALDVPEELAGDKEEKIQAFAEGIEKLEKVAAMDAGEMVKSFGGENEDDESDGSGGDDAAAEARGK